MYLSRARISLLELGYVAYPSLDPANRDANSAQCSFNSLTKRDIRCRGNIGLHHPDRAYLILVSLI